MAKKKRDIRKVPNLDLRAIRNLTTEDSEDIELVIDYIYTETPKAIEEAVKAKKQVATLFELNGSNVYLDISKSDWSTVLDKCIAHHSAKERYELCTQLQTLSTKLTTPKLELI